MKFEHVIDVDWHNNLSLYEKLEAVIEGHLNLFVWNEISAFSGDFLQVFQDEAGSYFVKFYDTVKYISVEANTVEDVLQFLSTLPLYATCMVLDEYIVYEHGKEEHLAKYFPLGKSLSAEIMELVSEPGEPVKTDPIVSVDSLGTTTVVFNIQSPTTACPEELGKLLAEKLRSFTE